MRPFSGLIFLWGSSAHFVIVDIAIGDARRAVIIAREHVVARLVDFGFDLGNVKKHVSYQVEHHGAHGRLFKTCDNIGMLEGIFA